MSNLNPIFTAEQMAQITTALNTKVNAADAKATSAQEAANSKQAQLYLHHINIDGDSSLCGGKITLINRSATPINTFELFKTSLTGIVNLTLYDEQDSGYYMLSYDNIEISTKVEFTNAKCLDAATMTISPHLIDYDFNCNYTDVVETL